MELDILNDAPFRNIIREVFASIKNPRRRAILDDLSHYEGLTLKQIARYLRKRKYYHSRSTIMEYYTKPLIRGGLISSSENGEYQISCLGEKIQRETKQIEEYIELLNQGKCYEEFFLTALVIADGQLSYSQLSEIVPMHTIARIEKRIEPFIQKHSARTSYSVTEKGKNGNFPNSISTSGKTLFKIIKDESANNGGIPATELFERTTLRPRTTYKHLRRLKENRLITSKKQTVTFSLTSDGTKVAEALYRITAHVLFEMKKKAPKSLIVDYLNTQNRDVPTHELVQNVLDSYFKTTYGRVTEICEVEQLINEMKVEGLLDGNRYQGYKLVLGIEEETIQAYPQPSST